MVLAAGDKGDKSYVDSDGLGYGDGNGVHASGGRNETPAG